jgi:hypothetical protein
VKITQSGKVVTLTVTIPKKLMEGWVSES